jgi:8-hydroxy-5-deazaflavin:NADPH oxidoreductase
VADGREQYFRCHRTSRSFEDAADCDDSDYAFLAHKAVFEKSPFAIPADHPRVDLEGLERLQVAPKLGDCVADDGVGLALSCDGKHSGSREPVHAADIGKCQISGVVDMDVEVQVIWPNAHANPRGRQQIDLGFGTDHEGDADQPQPRVHGDVLRGCSSIGGSLTEGVDTPHKRVIFGITQRALRILESPMKVRGIADIRRRDLFRVAALAATLGIFPLTARMVMADDGKKLRIGIIGSGRVGRALGGVWANAGHEVMFSSRNLDNDKKLAADVGANARAGTPQEAAAFGQVVVFAIPYSAFPDLIKSFGNSLKGKLVINASNPSPQRDGPIADEARAKGAGLFDAQLMAGAHVVRAFNAVGAARMASAHEDPGKIGMPIAGDDKKALEVAARLIREVGFEPVVVGGLDMGKYLMPGTPLAGEHTPDEVRSTAATLKP